MKRLIVHLSDVHLRKTATSNPIMSRVDNIAAAVASTALDIRCCFVVVSGDIAYTGSAPDYEVANEFLSQLVGALGKRLSGCDVKVLVVPGNHDCDFARSNNVRNAVIAQLSPDGMHDDIIAECASVQDNYRAFASQWLHADSGHDRVETSLITRVVYDSAGTRFDFRLINSSWMSSIKEQQGRLLFPVKQFDAIGDQGKSDIVIAVMHHPYNWYEAENGRELRGILDRTSDLILTGHEHERDAYVKQGRTGETLEYVEGGVLQNPSNHKESSFNVLVFDPETGSRQVRQFVWTENSRYEEESAAPWIAFRRNSARLRNEFEINGEFERYLHSAEADFAHPVKDPVNIDDLFVYPDLQRVMPLGKKDAGIIQVTDRVPQLVLEQHHLLILGNEKSGKTALAKMLFQDLRSAGLVPVLVSGQDFKRWDEDHVVSRVQELFMRQYSVPTVSGFMQLTPTQRAIIVDDFHRARANVRGRDQIAATLSSFAGTVVLLATDTYQVVELASQGKDSHKLWEYEQYAIRPFGHAKRADLIRKWVFLGRTYSDDEIELYSRCRATENVVSTVVGRNFIPAHPIYVLLLLHQLESRNPVPVTSTTSSYGYLYESLLTRNLSIRPDAGLDTQYTYLSRFAYELFKRKQRSITISDARSWHAQHCRCIAQIEMRENAL